ncbi:MAG TPA: L,D-transpeptidase [Dehalococcoidia bacterium]|nr:L,D-transpeptidase [Dehalococcoidia bacterium]
MKSGILQSPRHLVWRLAGALALGFALLLLSQPVMQPKAIRADSLSINIPGDVGQHEHWVDVNLSKQVTTAMDGTTPVRAIYVTTGMPGFETPTGTFHVMYRVEDERMTSDGLGIPPDNPDGYDLSHVLYTQYFTNQGHALHDNYWRPDSVFGSQATSHGCVGMELDDAYFLWSFLNTGSRVVIHG